jgi:TolA-binding protein
MDGIKKDSINFRTAEIRFENANYNEAIKSLTSYIQNFPNGTFIIRAFYLRAESYSLLKKYGESLADYDQVVKKGSSRYYLESLEKAALISYNYSKDFGASYSYYTQLESLAANSTKLFEYQVGAMQSAYRAKNREGSTQYAQKIANHPSATNPQKAFANFYLGKISYDRGLYSDALRFLEIVRNISDNEQTAEARFLIASIFYEMKDYAKAREICINSNKESSAFPYWVAKSVLLLSDVLLKQNEIFNSRAALEALLENYKGDQELIEIAKEKLKIVNQLIENNSRINNNPAGNLLETENEN